MTKKIRTTPHPGKTEAGVPKPEFGDQPWQTPEYGEPEGNPGTAQSEREEKS